MEANKYWSYLIIYCYKEILKDMISDCQDWFSVEFDRHDVLEFTRGLCQVG